MGLPLGQMAISGLPSQVRTRSAISHLESKCTGVATSACASTCDDAIGFSHRHDEWLHSAFHAGIPSLRSFVVKLRQDQKAVLAGLVLSYSHGVVKGHHRFKSLKRQMDSRANFDLFRLRSLHGP